MSSRFFEIREHIVPAQHIREYPGATISQEASLQVHVKQYIPLSSAQVKSEAITIIAAHANGFPKELYETLWDEIYNRCRDRFSIRSIWIADAAHQGQSYVLNETLLSNDPSWYDHSRDLLHMINHFRSEMPRPIVGIGHSFGGTQLVNLSLMHPRLFVSLVLLDPVIELGPTTSSKPGRFDSASFSIATASTHRRDLWPSREHAAASFANSPFYQRWDERVFESFVQHGLRKLPTALYPEQDAAQGIEPPVTLTTTKHQEVWTYLRPNYHGQGDDGLEYFDRRLTPDITPGKPDNYPFYRPESSATFYKLPSVRPSVLYIMGGESTVSDPGCQRDKVKLTGVGTGGSGGITERQVSDVILPGIGHLVPMEAPSATAQETVNWLERVLKHWQDEEKSFGWAQSSRPKRDHLQVDDDWIRHVGRVPRRKDKHPGVKL